MTNNKSIDYLIIGQGLAGTLLAHFLLKQNKKVYLIDKHHDKAASKVAAGIINPITGRRFVKSWMIDTLIPFAKTTYQEIEAQLNVKIFYSRNIVRGLFSIKEENEWLSRSADISVEQYVETVEDHSAYQDILKEVISFSELKAAAQVDIPTLIDAYKTYFLDKEILIQEAFKYDELNIETDGVNYKGIKASKIIFCEGFQAKNNPWFKDLKYVPAKGEVLIVKIPKLPREKLLKHKIIIAPLKDDLFWVGSNYDWKFLDDKPTLKGKEALLKKLEKAINVPFEIVEHLAAIRPTVFDRRPFLGNHQDHPQLCIFNGLGTKGASLGPFWANHMTAFLAEGLDLNPEVNINRS